MRRGRDEDDITDVGGDTRGLEEDDDDEDEASLSLAAMESELRPQVMETFDVIASTYTKLRKLQVQQVENRLAASGKLTPSQERRYKELKEQLIRAVKSLSLKRIEAPASAVSSPAMMRSSVVLPQPDGPSSETISPSPISRSVGCKTRVPPEKVLAMLRRARVIG